MELTQKRTYTTSDIAAKINVSPQQIWYWAKHFNIPYVQQSGFKFDSEAVDIFTTIASLQNTCGDQMIKQQISPLLNTEHPGNGKQSLNAVSLSMNLDAEFQRIHQEMMDIRDTEFQRIHQEMTDIREQLKQQAQQTEKILQQYKTINQPSIDVSRTIAKLEERNTQLEKHSQQLQECNKQLTEQNQQIRVQLQWQNIQTEERNKQLEERTKLLENHLLQLPSQEAWQALCKENEALKVGIQTVRKEYTELLKNKNSRQNIWRLFFKKIFR